MPVAARSPVDPEQLRQPRLDEGTLVGVWEVLLQVSASFCRAASGASSSPIRQRIRSMSASAQYATPSPYARQRPRCQ